MKYRIFLITTICLATLLGVGACTFDYGVPAKESKDSEEGMPDPVVVPANKTFVHPGLFHTNNDFLRMKLKVEAGEEPWISGWNVLCANSHSSYNYNMQGPVVKLIRGGNSTEEPENDNYATAFNDAAAAYQNAVRWKISGENLHAEKAIQILNAWANTCLEISGNSNKALAAGIYGHQFANAAEIMRDYEGWKTEDLTVFKQWLVDVFLSVSKDYLATHYGTCDTHYWANWDLANILNVMSIGILTDDVETYTYAIDYLMEGSGNGQILKAINYFHAASSNDDIDLGQIQESGRDQGHAMLCIGQLGNIAQTAGNQGEDIWGYNNNAILKGAEYQAKFNFANLDVPFHEYVRYYDKDCKSETHTKIANDQGRGGNRPIWELLYAHYTTEKGIKARYLKIARDIHFPEGGGGDYGPNSGGYDALGFGTLLYARD